MCMIPLYTTEEFQNSKSRDALSLKCECCNSVFYKMKNQIQWALKKNGLAGIKYCSQKCVGNVRHITHAVTKTCRQCDKSYTRKSSHQRYKNNFCSKSCAATYNNTHKTTGHRRSKLEIWLEQQLAILYPNLEIHYNKTDAINAELDIYIPSLKLAFELNGIFHYEPIYGNEKFDKTISNDKRKFQACLERGISLCIIDTSKQKYFKEKSSMEFCKIISNIIDRKLAEEVGFEPTVVF